MQNVVIFGDSYSTFEGYIPEGYACYYKNDKAPMLECVEQTWWKLLSKELKLNIKLNDSYSGSTVCTSVRESQPIEAAFVKRADKYIAEGYFADNKIDTVFIFGGTNDSWIGSPIGRLMYTDWQQQDLKSVAPAFCYLIDRLKKTDSDLKIVAVINTELKTEVEEKLAMACEHYSVDCVRLCDIDKVNGHPTILGMKQIAEQIKNYILKHNLL